MHTVRDNPTTDGPCWIRAFKAKYGNEGSALTRDEWDELLGDCQAVCDIPAAFFGHELAEAYPEAKVIILNRDPESWYDSVLNSIHSTPPPSAKFKMLFCLAFDRETRSWAQFGMTMKKLVFGYDHSTEKDKALLWYEKQYAEFRDKIPEDRRIEYKVGDGWRPLCEFLDLSVPTVKDESTGEVVEAPFPRLNDRQAFLQDMASKKSEMASRALDNVFWAIGRAAVAGSVAYAGYLIWKTRLGGRI